MMITSICHINHFRILISLVRRLLETELGRRQMRSRMLVPTIKSVHHCRNLSRLLRWHCNLCNPWLLLIIEWRVFRVISDGHLSHHFLIKLFWLLLLDGNCPRRLYCLLSIIIQLHWFIILDHTVHLLWVIRCLWCVCIIWVVHWRLLLWRFSV